MNLSAEYDIFVHNQNCHAFLKIDFSMESNQIPHSKVGFFFLFTFAFKIHTDIEYNRIWLTNSL